MTLQEINTRLVELRSQIDLPEVDLESIETEINNLLEEKRTLNDKAEKREALIQKALVEPQVIVEQYEERNSKIILTISERSSQKPQKTLSENKVFSL